MKPYPAYKDSGIEWIGEIPENYVVTNLKHICDKITDGSHFSPETQDYGIPYITVQDVKDDFIDFDNSKRISETDYLTLKRNGCQPLEGDVLLTKDGTIGKAVVVKNKNNFAILSSLGLIRPSPAKLLPEYLRYYLTSGLNIDQMFSFIRGSALTRLTIKLIEQLLIVYPSIPEQQDIITFLDKKTSQIDAVIEKKQKQIELLKEERTAIINHVVTKGLNPDVPMKDSGIEWLGEVPEHWEIAGLTKYLESIVDYRGKTPQKTEEGIFLVTAKNVKNGIIDYSLSQEYINTADYEKVMSRGYPEIGDVLFTTEAPLGEVANVDNEDIALAQRIIKFRANKNYLDNYFLKFWLLSYSFQSDLQRYATGSTAQGIKASKLNHLKVVLPPLVEQESIVSFIDTSYSETEIIIGNIQNQISLLQEYRTSLISNAVTGKIDVRNEVELVE
ncbi:restriction endonuclease subunit S [Methanolobus bombayensis]|uniref:restriction endonuclease subunit S n=1 Tax=Methanolobus bombayensis TaxID=38023 RepID=UPI001AE8F45F|nr:restriction endonuclease subunit S [Methanolobus bombayensis]MBP1908330.1 type I restriction enzyme S subunit [Methanolobus bombayensis]